MLAYLIYTKNYAIVYNNQTNNANIIFLNFFDVLFVDNVNTH